MTPVFKYIYEIEYIFILVFCKYIIFWCYVNIFLSCCFVNILYFAVTLKTLILLFRKYILSQCYVNILYFDVTLKKFLILLFVNIFYIRVMLIYYILQLH